MAPVGILALQGCVEQHREIFSSLGAECRLIRLPEELREVDRLVLPGGESTTMLKLIRSLNLWEPLLNFGKTKAVWGICAGAILIAKKVSHPEQQSLGLIDIHAIRNFYGSQRESFNAEVAIPSLKIAPRVDFIRAPKLEALSSQVQILGTRSDEAVLFRQGSVLASSFHIELSKESALHQYFLSL